MGVALLALMIALGGTSYAVTKIDPRSVGNKQLKRNAVARANIRANAVTSSKVADNSLKGADIDESSLAQVLSAATAARAATADNAVRAATADDAVRAATAASADRAAVADRATTADNVALATVASGLERIVYKTATGSVPAAPNDQESTEGSGTARCDSGQLVIGGGARVDAGMGVTDSHPDGTAGWTAGIHNDDPDAGHGFSVFAICVRAGAAG
jgi:hypothetical protein